jgi:hypothetical protein
VKNRPRSDRRLFRSVFRKNHLSEDVVCHYRPGRPGCFLGLAMFAGALLGTRLSIWLGDRWVRRTFLTAVWALGLKALFFDVLTLTEKHGGEH